MSLDARLSSLTPQQRALFEALRQKQRQAAPASPPPVERVSGPDGAGDWPLTFDQERGWFLYVLDPESTASNMISPVRIGGDLDPGRLEWAVNEVLRRHAGWRTAFPMVDGRPVQRVAPELTLRLPVVDLTALADDRRQAVALELVYEQVRRPFVLESGPLLRVLLLRLGAREHVCVLTLHHIVGDMTSLQIFWYELALLTARGPGALPEPQAHLADFAVWQRRWMDGEVLRQEIEWWRERLQGFPLVLDLPTDRPRPNEPRGRGSRHLFQLNAEETEVLRALARREGMTRFMVFVALSSALFHRLSGQERLVLGTLNANRGRPEVQASLGYFITQLPLPVDLSGDPSCRELLARARQVALDAFAHQHLPFGKLVEALQPERDPGRMPVIQTLVQLVEDTGSQAMGAADHAGGLSIEAIEVDDGNARLDLMFALFEAEGLYSGRMEYDSDLFDGATVARMVDVFRTLLAAAAADPGLPLSRLPVLSVGARHQVLVEWNDTAALAPGWTVIERFEAQATRAPEAPALAFSGAEISFGDLDRRAERLARRLCALGVGRESRVALLLERSPALVESILAIWKAGGACVPLDPEVPPARLAALLADADPAVLIHDGRVPLPAGLAVPVLDPAGDGDEGDLGEDPRGEDLAYMIYTSGTTGLPKAVLVEHRSLAHTLAAVQERFGFGPGDRMPHLARFSFDISLFELLAPLLAGGACELLRQEEILDQQALLAAVSRATRLHAVPSLMRRIAVAACGKGLRLETVFTGGDLVPPDLLAELADTFPEAERVVLYGPTEATIVCTSHRVTERPSRALIGRPFANVEARVMDRWGEAPLGVPGELWIGGPGVARGYHRREELTAERFVERDGRRFYRTGDLVRYLSDGTLEFLGRTDHQVKIRGFRVEPGEVEAQLAAYPAVREAAVIALEDGRGERRLVAYCAGEAGPVELRDHLSGLLPPYMVPSAFVILPELPLTAHGKLDRARLPRPEESAPGAGEGTPPATPAEELVAGIWREVLGLARVSRGDNFFELGGHSLLATQVATRLRESLGVEVPVRALFQAPTLAELGAEVESALAGDVGIAPPIHPVPRDRDLPLSFAQERLWFIDRLNPGLATYNIFLALRARGELSVPALEAALGEIFRRHEALRTTFHEESGRPVQVIHPPSRFALPAIDLSGLPAEAGEREALRLAEEDAARPFDLSQGPVIRPTLLRLEREGHVLLLNVHHVAFDAWSTGVLLGEMATLYQASLEGALSPLSELPVQYADFAVWQREWLTGEVLERQIGYWRERLAGAPALALPTDHPRPARGPQGGSVAISLPPERLAALNALSGRHGATLFMTLLAAFQALLGRLCGQDDVVVGSPIANRTRAETEPLIGFFVNSLVLRGDLSGDPGFAGLLSRVRRTALEAYSHQDLPFDRLVSELRPDRQLAQNPLFQVVCAVQNAPVDAIALPGLTFSPLEHGFVSTRFDLELMFWDTPAGFTGQLLYAADLFEPATAERLTSYLENLLAAVLEDPQRPLSLLPILPAAERSQILEEWSGPAPVHAREATIHGLFAEQAARTPDAVALACGDEEVTYAELAARAGRIAARLASLGLSPESRIAVVGERSPALIAQILGILQAGCAYLPLDPDHPLERLAFLLADSGAAALLGERRTLAALPADLGDAGPRIVHLDEEGPEASLPSAVPPEGLAYVMYTSGSTGTPKGVAVTHRNVIRLVKGAGFAELGPEQAFLQLAPVAFDASTLEIWGTLLNGGRLVIQPSRRASLDEIAEAIAGHGVTSLWLTAGLFHQMVDERPEALRPLRQLLAGGDVLSPSHVRRALGVLEHGVLINGYGPTENTTFTACHRMTPGDADGIEGTVPIGTPIRGTRAYVLDAALEPVPAGFYGELYAGGDGVSRGYLGCPDLTAERFVPDPFGTEPGGRLYRTGDLVRWRDGGVLEFLGRRDGQVKVRGFRIELGEVEAALARSPGVGEAAVLLREDRLGDRRLVAYVTAAGEPLEAAALRRHLAASLPEPMVPSAFVVLGQMPLTPVGKVDRRALPAPEATGLEREYLAPSSPVEEQLAGVCAAVLGVERVGMHDNFFELGGHSLLATQLVARLRDQYGIELPLAWVFEAADLLELADRLVQATLAEEMGGLSAEELEALLAGETA